MKIKKISMILIVTIILITVFSTTVQANSFQFPTWSELKTSAQNFIGRGGSGYISDGEMGKIFVPMASILFGFGIIVLVGATIIMGIKYMFASPEEAAKLKQQLVGLVVAAVVIFGAVGIVNLVFNVLNSIL